MDVDHSSNVERLEYLYLNMVGQIVQVHTIDGCISEGIFVSRTDPETSENEAGIFLSFPRFLQSANHKPLDPAELSKDARLFCYKDIVMLDVVHLRLRTETPGMGNVHCYRGEHDLKTLDWAEECTTELLESEKLPPGEWDQFKANERFGVTSTYKEDFYTTKLDRTKITKEQMEYADRVARAIENSATRGIQHQAEREEIAALDLDEGILYSDVIRDLTTQAGKKPPSGTTAQQQPQTLQQQPQSQPPGRKAAPEVAAGKAATGKRGATDEGAPTPIEGGQIKDFNPNPAAPPFVPTRPIIRDYLRCIADAINNNPECYASLPDWPGEEDHYDKDVSSYSHQLPHSNQVQSHSHPSHPHHHHPPHPHPHHHPQQTSQQHPHPHPQQHPQQQQHQQPPPQPQQQQQQQQPQQQPMGQSPGRGMAPQSHYMGMPGKGYTGGAMSHSMNRPSNHPMMHQHHMPHQQYDMGNPNNNAYGIGGGGNNNININTNTNNPSASPPLQSQLQQQQQQQQQQQPYVDQSMMGPSSSRMGVAMQQQTRGPNKSTQPQQPVVTALPMQGGNSGGRGPGSSMGGGQQQQPPGPIPEIDSAAQVTEKQPPKKLRRGGAAAGGMASRNDTGDGGQGSKKK